MKSRFAVIFAVTALMIICFQWLLPGIRVAIDFPRASEALLKYSMNLPFVWSETGAEGIGEYSSFFLWNWPLSFTVGILANLGLSFIFLEKYIFIASIFIIGTVGIWKLSKYLHLSNFACLVSTALYLLNTYLMLLIDGGQLSIALAYTWFPICFLSLDRAINRKLNFKIFTGIAIAILGFFDVRFIYILIFLASIRFLYELMFISKKDLFEFCLKWVKSGIILSFIVLGLHFYWLYPLFKAPLSSQIYQVFTRVSYLSTVNIGHSLLMLAPHWFMNIFGKITPLRFEFILIPILVLLAPVLRIKNRDVGFWLVVMVISLFLSKGFSEPFPQIYTWLFNHVPGFSLFRDSTKFFFLVTLSYSVLIGIAVDEISRKLKLLKRARIVILVVLISDLIFLLRPIWFGQMTGIFSPPQFQKEYSQLSTILENDKAYGRVFWIPFFPPLGYSDLNHPRIEASRATQKRLFAVGTKGTYETFNFLRESSYMGEIFDVAGIEYIVYPYLDQRRDNMHPDNIKYYYTFLDQLSKRPWLEKVEDLPIPLFKVREHQDRFFITSNVWWAIGSDNLLNEATKSARLKLFKNALIFAEEYPGLSTRLDELPNAKIILNNKTDLDLAANFISPTNLIFPATKLNFDPDESGWWKREAADLIRWRSFLQEKYGIDNQDFDLGGGWAVGEGEKKYQISNIKYQKGNILLARVMESSRSGKLKFYQDNQLIGEVSTKINGDTNVRWFEVGYLVREGGEIVIESFGDINVVNAIAVLDKDEWVAYQDKSRRLQERVVNFEQKYAESNNNPAVVYQKINPTKYRVIVNSLTKPSLLVFSQTYDGFWKTNGQTPFPVYSLLNGFKVEKDGEYIIEFEPQKYVYPGLIISGITVIALSMLLVKLRNK